MVLLVLSSGNWNGTEYPVLGSTPAWPGSPDANILLKYPFLTPWPLIGPTPDTGPILIDPVSMGWDEVRPSFEKTPLIGSIPFNQSQPNNQPDLLLMTTLTSDCLHWEPNQNHPISLLPFTTPYWCQYRPDMTSSTPCEVLPMFMCTNILKT